MEVDGYYMREAGIACIVLLWSDIVGSVFFFQAEDGIRDVAVTGVQTCALPICVRADSRYMRLPVKQRHRKRLSRTHTVRAGQQHNWTAKTWAVAEVHHDRLRHSEIGRASCRERV